MKHSKPNSVIFKIIKEPRHVSFWDLKQKFYERKYRYYNHGNIDQLNVTT